MKVYIVQTIFGIFALDENKKVLDYILFEKNFNKAYEEYKKCKSNKLSEKESELIKKFNKEEIVFVTFEKENYKYEKEKFSELFPIIKDFLASSNLVSKQEIIEFQLELAKKEAREKIKELKLDKIASNIIAAIEENEKLINTLTERIRTIFSLYFPEFEKKIKDHETFLKTISEKIKREELDKELAEKSIGMDFRDEDLKILQEFAKITLKLIEFNKELEKYLERLMNEIAPNFTYLAGYKLAAKILRGIGSLEKIVKNPASSIQLVGAEKALFRYLHGKGKMPKHGYIYLHPLIQQAPKKLRGKIARALATKLLKAAKIDYFSKRDEREKLKKELDERIKEIYEEEKT